MTLTDLLTAKRELNSYEHVRRKRAALNTHGAYRECGRAFLSMGCVKGDDSAITWDSVAMRHGRPWMAPTKADYATDMGHRIGQMIVHVFRENPIEL